MLVYGEAGVGKTRLVNELVHRARDGGVYTLVGGCAAIGGHALAFAPFVEALRPLAAELATGTHDDVTGAGLVTQFVAQPSDGNAHGGRPDDAPAAVRVGEMAQTRLFEDVVDALERVATPGGAVLVIEDLHWADASSRSLFDFIVRNLRGVAVALVGTVRNDEPPDPELSGWLAELQRGGGAVRIDVEPFTRPEVGVLIEGVLGERPPDETTDRVFERSGGNAFLAQELLAADDGGGDVPPSVRDLLLARTRRLTAAARELFALAAAFGTDVGHDLLALASGFDPNEFDEVLRELVDQQLLVVTTPGLGYAFRHALTREAAYGDLLPGERQRLHAACARALDEGVRVDSPAAVRAATIAEHWDAAGDAERALRAHVDAGNAAERVFAYADALRHFERALDLWDRVRDAAAFASADRPALLAAAAEVASAIGEDDQAIDHTNAAIAELQSSGALPIRIGLLHERESCYLTRAGRDLESGEALLRAKALIPAEPPSAARAQVLRVIAGDLKVVGRYAEARREAELVLQVARLAAARKQEAAARKIIGYALIATGEDIDLGIHELQRALAIGREIADEEEVILAATDLSDSLIRLGRYDEAATIALDGAEAGRRRGAARNEVGFITMNAVEALIPAGRWDDAERIIQQVLALRAGVQIELMAHNWSALINAQRGQLDAASAALARADRVGPDAVQPQLIMIVETARAHLKLATGDLQEARQAVARMLDVGMSDDLRYVAPAAALGLRIEADRTSLARARRDTRQQDAAVGAAHTLADHVRNRARSTPSPPETANIALCDAELGRADGRSDPDQWREAVEAFVAIRQPYEVAYARFREGEMALAVGGDRARAVAALNAAHGCATELGAEPLATEIEALARRARITLTEPVPAEPRMLADASTSSARPEAPLGLTAREVDVLRLVAAGQTNPQIAEALYISRKTASHHVSNILRKLGVSTRVEAAGVAHRLGLDRDVAGAK